MTMKYWQRESVMDCVFGKERHIFTRRSMKGMGIEDLCQPMAQKNTVFRVSKEETGHHGVHAGAEARIDPLLV